MIAWLKDAIFYQIYPTSFYDKNGDGIGDLQGIIEKLPYVKGLGANAIWINPFYKSPFMDGGYDIENYYAVDERFGSMHDFETLVAECKRLGLRIVLDLVVGHTSFKNEWFQKSGEDERNDYSDFYIWTDSIFFKYKDKTIHGLYPRNGGYYINYYACQPALNYGFNRIEESEAKDSYDGGNAWMMHYTDERLRPLREEILNVMRFWLNKGIDGFRVDLANSLVKGCVYDSDKDEDIEGNRWLWEILIGTIKKEYGNDVAFIAEWCNPANAVGKCGFDVDFFAHDIPCYNDLFRNEPNSNLLPAFELGYSFFGVDGKGSIENFLQYSLRLNERLQGKGYYSVPSGSHDQVRLAERKDEDTLKNVFAFLLTYSHVPFIYYGDEIGIRHNFQVNKDGGYIRTGARTPMVWNDGENRGFSSATDIYLPVDNAVKSVEEQTKNSASLLNAVKALCKIRKSYPCLQADGTLTVSSFGHTFVEYTRSNPSCKIRVIIHQGETEEVFPFQKSEEILLSNNVRMGDGKIFLKGAAFAVIKQ